VRRTCVLLTAVFILCSSISIPSLAAGQSGTVYVAFWFDTEDSILPEADDAAKRLAEMFTERGVQATFKIVGETERLPSVVWVAGEPVRPEDFAVTLASVVASSREMTEVTLRRGTLEAEKYVSDDRPGLWGWVIFPEGFNAPAVMEIAKLQAWTIKPAILRRGD